MATHDEAGTQFAMDGTLVLRSFYVLCAASILAASSTGFTRRLFIQYGARTALEEEPSSSSNKGSHVFQQRQQRQSRQQSNGQRTTELQEASRKTNGSRNASLTGLLERTATWTVPHSWFTQFYVLSVALSLFWAQQIISKGRAFDLLASSAVAAGPSHSMTMPQVTLLWTMLFIQGTRRLCECLWLSRGPSSSRMWIVHWVVGCAFYLATSIAVWIEGIPAIRSWPGDAKQAISLIVNLKSAVGILGFIYASGLQHDCHSHLASLKKYSLPQHPAFSYVVSPHYSCECAIYAAMTIVGAPPGALVNRTLGCALAFVVVNLGVTAAGTRRWYLRKFGEDEVEARFAMVPGVW